MKLPFPLQIAKDAKFKTFGCGSAIASSSYVGCTQGVFLEQKQKLYVFPKRKGNGKQQEIEPRKNIIPGN